MSLAGLGIVEIGRNEGARLRLCLESLREFQVPTIYVDSDSTDGSVELAQEFGVPVLQLDATRPCSAARARQEGFRQLLSDYPDLDYVFFVDGDCQVDPEWPAVAVEHLSRHEDVAAVCGRRREQNPEASVYNRLCDFEWDTPVGEAISVGGDAVYRVAAYREAGEFDPSVPAGEEPELCKRIRDRGWKIWRLDSEMTRHDAAMNRFGQWWKRQIRTGYAGYNVERRFGLGIFDRIIKSACFWGGCFPIGTTIAAAVLGNTFSVNWAVACLVVAIVVVMFQVIRIALRKKTASRGWIHSLEFGLFTMAAKVPICLGVIRQIIEAARGKQAQLVEYKSAESIRTQS